MQRLRCAPVRVRIAAALLAALFASGCAYTPKTPAQQAEHSISYAAQAASKGEARNVRINIDYVTTLHGEAERIAELFQGRPDAAALYVMGAARYIDSIAYPGQVTMERDSLAVLRTVNALPAIDMDALDSRLIDRVRQGNLDGSIPFEMIDSPESLALLGSPDHMYKILERSIRTTAQTQSGSARQIRQLMEYAGSRSTSAQHKKLVEAALDSFYIEQDELTLVEPVFPSFAKRRAKFLASNGAAAGEAITVGASAWEAIPEKDRAAIMISRRVKVLAADSYGLIADAQMVNQSTAGSSVGSAVGGGLGQAMYVNRAIDNNSYSMWSQIGAGLLGMVAGSAMDSGPVARFQHRYTVKLGSGAPKYFEQTNSSQMHHSVGLCVSVPNIEQLPQALCEETSEDLRARLLPAAMKM